MRGRSAFAACLVLWSFATSAGAITQEDVVKLSQAGVSDEILISQIQAEGTVFQLSAAEIVNLKTAKVSEKVIAFMIQTRRGAAGAPAAPAEAGAACGAEAASLTLVLANADDRTYSLQIDEGGHMIFYYYGNFQDRLSLGRGETRSIPLSPGEWVVRWVGEREAYRFRGHGGQVVKLLVTGVDFQDYRSTNLTITVGDREVASGALKRYVDRGSRRPVASAPLAEAQPLPAPSSPPVVVNYYPQPTGCLTYRDYYSTPSYYAYGAPSYSSSYYPDTYYVTRRSHAFITPSTLFFSGLGAVLDKHNRAEGALAGFAFSKFLDGAAYGDPLFGW
ncbi:MAG: hypothetical protein HYZ53_13730 [Planctomycetes bacterium]|nr:hypothetical protein [Planctomycetota bacterium]